MKKTVLLFIGAGTLLATACHKTTTTTTANVTETEVLTDFVQKIALPQYQDLQDKATVLNNAVIALNSNTTNANLDAARTAWRNVRTSWEQCEGFLIGPVEDDNYDPNMDTWPVDYLQLDSFITNSTSFSAATVQGLGQSLRGFHPLEFILWGKSGLATADSISASQKQYMTGLSQDILSTVTALNSSWAASGSNFQSQVINAGGGSTLYTTRQEALLAIAAGMADICDEVGNGKMYEPFAAYDSNKSESPFSHNSMTDFTSNIRGAQNVYSCTYNSATGASLSSFVSSRNLSLDNKIKQQYAAALTALGNVSVNFETAIYSQRTQLQNAMNAIKTLQATLDGDLKAFIISYVKD